MSDVWPVCVFVLKVRCASKRQWVRRSGRIFTPCSQLWILCMSLSLFKVSNVLLFLTSIMNGTLNFWQHRILTVGCDVCFFFFSSLANKYQSGHVLSVGVNRLSVPVNLHRVLFFSVCLDTSCSALVTEGCRWGLDWTSDRYPGDAKAQKIWWAFAITAVDMKRNAAVVRGSRVWNQRNLCYMYIKWCIQSAWKIFFLNLSI